VPWFRNYVTWRVSTCIWFSSIGYPLSISLKSFCALLDGFERNLVGLTLVSFLMSPLWCKPLLTAKFTRRTALHGLL